MKIMRELPQNAPAKGYELVVTTMEGDADDYHCSTFHCGTDEGELREHVIAAEVMRKTYPHGRGGGHEYEGPYWDLFSDDWHWSGDYSDSMDTWEVVYHDGTGAICPCTVTLEDDDKAEIEEAQPQDGGRLLLSNHHMAISALGSFDFAVKRLKADESLTEKELKEKLVGWEVYKQKNVIKLKEAEEALVKRGIPIP